MTLLLEGKESRAHAMMDEFQFTSETPALYYAQAAWEFQHNNPEKAADWAASANKIYSPALNSVFADAFYDVGWMQRPAAATMSTPALETAQAPSVSEHGLWRAESIEEQNGRTWQAWIGEFVKQFVANNQLKNTDATLAFYAPNVQYFDDGWKDQAYIRNDIEKYNERWPVRRDLIEGDIHLQEKAPDKEYSASFKLSFYAESAPRAVWTKGQFAIDLDISIIDGTPRISGIKEKMLHQQKGKPNAAVQNSPTPANRPRYPYGIPVAGRPGFVKSPYAASKGLVDVRRYRKGASVKCPFTGKIFIIP
jgi:hypothetical protein